MSLDREHKPKRKPKTGIGKVFADFFDGYAQAGAIMGIPIIDPAILEKQHPERGEAEPFERHSDGR